MSQDFSICVIGAGLAGSECAYQLSQAGLKVALIEMRPEKSSPAHKTGDDAELVCSNSLRALDVSNAVGLLKEEMASLGSLVIRAAYHARVPAGGALAVDREVFSQFVRAHLDECATLTRVNGEVLSLDQKDGGYEIRLSNDQRITAERVVIATGPLTSDALASWIGEKTGQESLYFYDSIAPIVNRDSIDMKVAFRASRYGKGSEEGDYINCPMNEEQYKGFIQDILAAELIEVKDFDKAQFFEGCLPIEEMVSRGEDTLRYGPLKPVGLTNPHDPENRAYAVVQLRQDNVHGSLYNMVGFQTRMKYPEQTRIFKKIPGLENAEFYRMGSMHRNTYLCSPRLLEEGLQLKAQPGVHFAGQITGCEGYVESAAVGLYLGHVLRHLTKGKTLPMPPHTTALGALIHHLLHGDPEDYQPMNINWGLFAEIEGFVKKHQRKTKLIGRAAQDFRRWFYAAGF